MSAEKLKTFPGVSRQAEERNLAKTLAVIRHNVETYSRDVTQMRDEIDTMLEHFHDDNPELINSLENTITMHDHLKRALERNERALNKPYFGRIIYHDETIDKKESLYIGKGGISKDATTPVVVDWRAPVANAYYENGLGKCSYASPNGERIDIDLQLKRTYEIENGILQNFFDTEVISNDDLLTKYLAKNKQAVLGEIVATIQKEQNAIIRKSPYHNCIVQGVAGSGKTTVAMHRISYILYNYAERFKPDDFYIVGSNRILLNYITGVLPSLDVYGVRQMTMEQLFVRLLYEDWDDKKYCIKTTSASGKKGIVKGSLTWFKDLQEYCRRLEWNTIHRDSIYMNPKQFVEGLRDGKSGVHDETDGLPASPENLVRLMDGKAVERYIRQNPTVSVQSKIDMLNERLYTKIKDEFLGKGVKYTVAEQKAIVKAYRGLYGTREWKKSIFAMYRDFLKEQIARGYDVDFPASCMDGGVLKTAFDVYDLAALAYLYKRIKETEVISEAHHVVIDEAQDFGMMAYSVLKFCIKDCTYTIMGDVSQNIHFGYGLNDWEELKELYLTDEMDSFCLLKKSYRNTVEISNFATDILHHGQFSIYPVEPIIRHGNPASVLPQPNRNVLIEEAATVCRQWQSKGLDTIAIICRDSASAAKTAQELGQYVEIMESDLEKAEFGNGIMVLPVEYTKGLEFDAVLILNPTRDEYPVDDGHAKLLYVAATRALHELCVLHTGNLTGLIADPVPERRDEGTAGTSTASDGRAFRESLRASQQAHPTGQQTQPSTKPAAIPPKPRIVINSPRKAAPKTDSDLLSRYTQPVTTKSTPAQTGMSSLSRVAQSRINRESYAFGDMPATEKLKPVGHSKIDLAIQWVSKQADGLYLQSRYGVLRLCPVGSAIIRITFAKSNRILDGTHPGIAIQNPYKAWMYKETPKSVELVTDEICLQVDKTTGAIQYLTRDKKLILAERAKECRQLETSPSGTMRSWLHLNWQKGETLYGISADGHANLNLRGTARYISQAQSTGNLPLLLSDKGYGLVIASDGPAFCCDISTYGSYVYSENSAQMDYYFIAGKKANTILSAYTYLCGKLNH